MYSSRLVLAGFLVMASVPIAAETPGLGEPASAELIEVFDYTILADGQGLPDGSGTAKEGAKVYNQHCLACHGQEGTDGINDRLAGGVGTLLTDEPVRTVGSFWPYSTTLFDYIRRAMPYQTPGTLSNDEIYALTAYILFLSDVVEVDTRLDAGNLADVAMPNSGDVEWDYREAAHP